MIQRLEPDLRRHFAAVNEVEKLLARVTKALDDGHIPYCVIGGNAVAAWVSTVDPGATRTTKDVDLLLRDDDLEAAKLAASKVDLEFYEVSGVPMFLPRENPNPKTGADIVLAGRRVKDRDVLAAPDVSESKRLSAGYNVLNLAALVRMKLVANRLRDQVHIKDLLELNLIDSGIERALPDELRSRLELIRITP